MFLGIDIGSSSSKVAIIDEKKELRAVSIINLGTGTNACLLYTSGAGFYDYNK